MGLTPQGRNKTLYVGYRFKVLYWFTNIIIIQDIVFKGILLSIFFYRRDKYEIKEIIVLEGGGW